MPPTARAGEISPETAALAAYMADAPARSLPEHVAAKTRLHVLDSLAAVISGARLRPGEIACAYVAGEGGRKEVQVPGTRIMTSARLAALAGGMMAHADETDDSHPGAFFHPGCAIVPAALAMAERLGAGGNAVLCAVALGYDVGARINLALGVERFYGAQGFSTHSFGAKFGAAAAAGALAKLDADQCRWLLSYTAQMASGLGSWARDSEHVEKAYDFGGMGAEHGVAAAQMVAAGMTGVDDVFSGERGFFHAYGGTIAELARGLGETFEIMNANIKKWSVGSPCQAPLDSLEHLMAVQHLKPEEVTRVTAFVPAVEAHIVDDRTMPDICLQHLMAILMLDGGLTFASTHDYARMADPAVRDLRGRIALISDTGLPRRAGAVELTSAKTGAIRHETAHVRGTAANPMTESEVAAKARDLMAPVLGPRRAARLIDRLLALETVADIHDLRALTRPRAAR
ncbi:MAG: MmgE/PrpD family protein [Alphaproteobacteria bacterium]|nr:MmgE/PrpD family protein [Alphaproteobacteria bacterium]